MATDAWVHMPRLTAELAQGWTAAESAVFTSPTGLSVTATTSRPPAGAGAPQLAAQHGQVLAESLTHFVETELAETTVFGGVPAVRRRFTFDREGSAWCGCTSYAVVDGLVCTLSAGWPAEHLSGGRAGQDFEVVAEGVRLMPDFAHPVGRAPEPDEVTAATGAAREQSYPLDPSRWQQLREAWSAASARNNSGSAAGPCARWSPDELQLCATLLGAAAFPTVDPESLLVLPEATRVAIVGAVGRSLLARHVIRSEDGRAVLSASAAAELEPAVFPDLAVQAQRIDSSGAQTWWFGVRHDRAVEVAVQTDGSRTCTSLDPADLLSRIAAVVGWAECRTGTGAVATVRPEHLFEAGSDFESVVRIWTLWREGTASVGGVLKWAIDVDGGLYSVAEESVHAETRWNLEPTDVGGAREVLLAHLPGGERQ